MVKRKRLGPPSKKKQNEFKSKFEGYVAEYLGEDYQYEVAKLDFIQPQQKRKYTPDFQIAENTFIECKGIFSADDRKKMLWVREQHPDKTFLLLFYNANQKLRKGSSTSYSDWADKNGFVWADWYKEGRKIPDNWLINNNKNKGTTNGNQESTKDCE